MISAHLQGGLGNQLFQIAAATALARRNKDVALFNLKYHDLPMQGRKAHCYLDNILRNVYFTKNFKPSHYYHESSFCYTPIEYRKGITIKGYFQSEKYFSDQKDLIRKMFSVDDTTKQQILEKYGTTLARQPVSLHVRRGDYLTEPDFMITQTRKYYNKAIETFSPDTTYLVFSDDIEWSKEQFPEENFLFAENNEDYVDLYLMSMCAHNIMTNSSFSWWAAWLNENKEKRVIAPSQWFAKRVNYNTSDLIPERWEKL